MASGIVGFLTLYDFKPFYCCQLYAVTRCSCDSFMADLLVYRTENQQMVDEKDEQGAFLRHNNRVVLGSDGLCRLYLQKRRSGA